MKIFKLVSDYLDANVFVIEKGNCCLIIDSGARVEDVKSVVGSKKVLAIFLTHGHYDHSRFCLEYAKEFDCPVFANKNIIKTMTDKEAIYSPKGEIIEDFSYFHFIEGDKVITFDDFIVDCYYCPGHSVCSECYLIEKDLFAGDVLFDKGFGRVDLKFSNRDDMVKSLTKLESLNFSKVYSGHGDESDYKSQQRNLTIFKKFLSR